MCMSHPFSEIIFFMKTKLAPMTSTLRNERFYCIDAKYTWKLKIVYQSNVSIIINHSGKSINNEIVQTNVIKINNGYIFFVCISIYCH